MFGFFEKKQEETKPQNQLKKLVLKRFYSNNGNYAELTKNGKIYKYGTTIGAVIDPIKPNYPPLFYTIEPPRFFNTKENNSDDSKTKKNESTCILAGEYTCQLTFSNRFQTNLYLVKNTKDRAGVRWHSGNHVDNSQGCILPALCLIDKVSINGKVFDYFASKSVDALEKLYKITEKKDFILLIDDKNQLENYQLITKYKGY